MSTHPASRCHHLGVCVLDADCHRRFECANEAREAARNDLARELPIQYAGPEPAEQDDAPTLRCEACLRALWLFACVLAGLAVAAIVLGLLWRHEATLRPLSTRLGDALALLYWASLGRL